MPRGVGVGANIVRNIGDWLAQIGLGKYAELFAENEIDWDALAYVTDEDLKDIGVALGARRKLLAAIATLTGEEGTAAPGEAPPPSGPSVSIRTTPRPR